MGLPFLENRLLCLSMFRFCLVVRGSWERRTVDCEVVEWMRVVVVEEEVEKQPRLADLSGQLSPS